MCIRDRRCEMLAEALRNMDVCRWRAMDQLITSPYVPQGFHLWNTPMEHWYDNSDGTSALGADGTSNSNVSPSSYSEYLCPFQKLSLIHIWAAVTEILMTLRWTKKHSSYRQKI